MPVGNSVTREIDKDVKADGDYYSEVVSLDSQETVQYAVDSDDTIIVEVEWYDDEGTFSVTEEIVSGTSRNLNSTGVKSDKARIRVSDDSAATNNRAQGFVRFN